MTSSYIIGYFDLLGYREMISDPKNDELIIGKIINFVDTLLSATDIPQCKTYCFSDNFAITMKCDNDIKEFDFDRLGVMIWLLQNIQYMLLLQHEIFIRGSIVKGDLYTGDKIIYGRGIVKAYDFENKIAIYPRIIIDGDLIMEIKSAKENNIKKYDNEYDDTVFSCIPKYFKDVISDSDFKDSICFIEDNIMYTFNDLLDINIEYGKYINYVKDYDGIYFVDYLQSMKCKYMGDDLDALLWGHVNIIAESILHHKDKPRILNKYLWCLNYHNTFCKNNGYETIANINNIGKIYNTSN